MMTTDTTPKVDIWISDISQREAAAIIKTNLMSAFSAVEHVSSFDSDADVEATLHKTAPFVERAAEVVRSVRYALQRRDEAVAKKASKAVSVPEPEPVGILEPSIEASPDLPESNPF